MALKLLPPQAFPKVVNDSVRQQNKLVASGCFDLIYCKLGTYTLKKKIVVDLNNIMVNLLDLLEKLFVRHMYLEEKLEKSI